MVEMATVRDVERDATEGRWRVETIEGGWTTTDSRGIGTYLLPVDEEVAQQFATKGSRFELEPMERHQLYREELDRDELYRDFDLTTDADGYGYET